MIERGGKERVKPESSSIADHQLHNMETSGTGKEMTKNQVNMAHVAEVTVTTVATCTFI